MNLLADESADRPLVERLRTDNHSVVYVAELDPGVSDDVVLEITTVRITAGLHHGITESSRRVGDGCAQFPISPPPAPGGSYELHTLSRPQPRHCLAACQNGNRLMVSKSRVLSDIAVAFEDAETIGSDHLRSAQVLGHVEVGMVRMTTRYATELVALSVSPVPLETRTLRRLPWIFKADPNPVFFARLPDALLRGPVDIAIGLRMVLTFTGTNGAGISPCFDVPVANGKKIPIVCLVEGSWVVRRKAADQGVE